VILGLVFKYVNAYMSVMRHLVLLNAALADENRLRLLNLIQGGEICVCHLQGVLRTNQPKISRHLAYLRKAGLVEARRDGKWTHYRLKKLGRNFERILSGTLNCLRTEPQIKIDVHRLKQITCCPSRFGFASPRVAG
jgi:ArsR family transcriptional regulator, arsenate/arsenite/antimonite-responsive transcriptional repressor